MSETPTHSDHSGTIDMRPFPMLDGPPIPWFIAEAIYKHLYRMSGQTLERMAERGGFGWKEVAYMWENPRHRTTREQRAACARAVRGALDEKQEEDVK